LKELLTKYDEHRITTCMMWM